MARETGKQRSQRIQIDYYRKKGGLQRLKTACVCAALVGSGLYGFYVLVAGGQTHTSTGPLSRAHAAFEDDCGQCHQDFTPIDARGAKLNISFLGINSDESIKHVETACQACHQVGSHHRDRMTEDWQRVDQNCAGCHADHKGRDFDLNLISAQRCTVCHANLSEGCQGEPRVRGKITSFTQQNHGDFPSLAKGDSGTVKFDHAQHLLPGQVNAGEKGQFTVAMLDESLRARYRKNGQADSSPVELDCASCHVMAGIPARSADLVTDVELGRYMAPISFEQHCSACHSMNPGVATADTTPLPHAVPWQQIDLLLTASITGAGATGQIRSPRDDTQSTPQPGEGLGKAAPAGSHVASPGDVESARRLVQTQCLQCHDQASITNEAIHAARSGSAGSMIPPRWFSKGLYNHATHREISCKFCHEAAYAVGVRGPATDHQSVMIAGIESCTPCHRDAESPAPKSLASVADLLGRQTTWASDNCTMCHRYHTLVEAAP